jgi:phage tail sheath protein FI
MAIQTSEHKRPGIYVKETPAPPVLPSVSPSGLGLVGYTLKGPANTATRVESFDTFREIFGGFTQLSLVPLTLEKYFNNGGQIAYIVRITPVGSLDAEGRLLGSSIFHNTEIADGVSTLYSDIIPDAPLAKAKLFTTLTGNGGATYTFTLTNTPIAPHSVGIIADTSPVKVAIDDDNLGVGEFIGDTVVVPGAINYATGVCSVTFDAVIPLGTPIRVYTTVNQIVGLTDTGIPRIAFDDGTGYLIGHVGIGANSLDYLTGEYSVTFDLAVGPTGVTVRLWNDNVGAAGNVSIISPLLAFTGMGGGTDYSPARGTIDALAGAAIPDTTLFTIDDGVNDPVTFEFDLTGSVTLGNVPVTILIGDTDVEVAAKMRTAINGASDLNVTAEPILTYDVRDRWLFPAQAEGTSGNDLKVEIQGSPSFRIQERDGEFASTTLLEVGAGSVGPYDFIIPNAPLIPNTVAVIAGAQVTYDDGSGSLIGPGAAVNSSVNYATGAVSVTFGASVSVGIPIRAHRDGFSYFDFIVSEYQTDTAEYLVKEVFEALDLVDSTSSDYLPTVVNDATQGSVYIDVVTGESGIPPTLLRGFHTQSLGTGDAVTRRFTGTLTYHPADPSSVKVTSGTAIAPPFQEALDDSVGFLTGPYIDPFGVNEINYETGAIDVTFKQPPAVGQGVNAIYAQQNVIETVSFEGGTDGTGVLTRAQIADPTLEVQKKGVYALNSVTDPLNVVVPDFAESALVLNDLIDYAEAPGQGKRFIIGATEKNLTPTEAKNYRRRDIRSTSSFCAVYYPWLKSNDSSIDKTRTIPPMGHVAGVYARVDRTRSEGKAPAGTSDGLLYDVVGLERILEPQDLDMIYPVNINPIVLGTGIGIYIDGARTLSTDKDFMFISTRRVFISYRARAEVALLFALFEPIGPALYARVKDALTNICLEFFQKGALAGTTPREAFVVTVDELNTATTVAARTIKCRVALAPTKPAEFIDVELTVNQTTGTVTVTI